MARAATPASLQLTKRLPDGVSGRTISDHEKTELAKILYLGNDQEKLAAAFNCVRNFTVRYWQLDLEKNLKSHAVSDALKKSINDLEILQTSLPGLTRLKCVLPIAIDLLKVELREYESSALGEKNTKIVRLKGALKGLKFSFDRFYAPNIPTEYRGNAWSNFALFAMDISKIKHSSPDDQSSRWTSLLAD